MTTQPLFLHPIGLDPQAKDWMELPAVLAPTLPGHGERQRPRADFTLSDIVDEVVGWTDGPVDVIGMLLGATVALHLALDYPNRVRSLFLACTGARADAAVMDHRADEIEAHGTPVDETLGRWFDPEVLAPEPEPPPVAYARRCLERVDHISFARNWRALKHHDVVERLPQIGVPTTWVAATRDVVHSPASIAGASKLIPDSRFVAIDAPHMAPLGSPQAVGQAIRDHLAWVSGRTE